MNIGMVFYFLFLFVGLPGVITFGILSFRNQSIKKEQLKLEKEKLELEKKKLQLQILEKENKVLDKKLTQDINE